MGSYLRLIDLVGDDIKEKVGLDGEMGWYLSVDPMGVDDEDGIDGGDGGGGCCGGAGARFLPRTSFQVRT